MSLLLNRTCCKQQQQMVHKMCPVVSLMFNHCGYREYFLKMKPRMSCLHLVSLLCFYMCLASQTENTVEMFAQAMLGGQGHKLMAEGIFHCGPGDKLSLCGSDHTVRRVLVSSSDGHYLRPPEAQIFPCCLTVRQLQNNTRLIRQMQT